MSENKVIIRINLDKGEKNQGEHELQAITVWHIPRILTAIFLLSLLLLLLVYWFSHGEETVVDKAKDISHLEAPTPVNTNTQSTDLPDINPKSKSNNQPEEIAEKEIKKIASTSAEIKKPAAIIYDRRVIRASLNRVIKDNEPYEQVKEALRLPANQAVEIYYFDEIKDINEKALYHYWFKDGNLVYKKQFELKENKIKAISSKKLSYRDKGIWAIKLVDRKGKIFSAVNFIVESE